MALDVLEHTLGLDLRFHLHRKTGEVTRIMDRGTNALQSILSTVLFNIGARACRSHAACASCCDTTMSTATHGGAAAVPLDHGCSCECMADPPLCCSHC